jgi:hypothetical protein
MPLQHDIVVAPTICEAPAFAVMKRRKRRGPLNSRNPDGSRLRTAVAG